MAMEFLVTSPDDLQAVSSFVWDSFENGGKALKVEVKSAQNRSLSQNAFMHGIFNDVSKYLVARGRGDCTPSWVKKMLKNKFLGWASEEFVDVLTGERTRRDVLRGTSNLDPGEACLFITQILEWAESVGCQIKIPEKCEYRRLIDMQND